MSTLTAGAGVPAEPAEADAGLGAPGEAPGAAADAEPGAALAGDAEAEADGAAAPPDAEADAAEAPFVADFVCASAATEYAPKGSARQTKLRISVTRRRIGISLLFELPFERGPLSGQESRPEGVVGTHRDRTKTGGQARPRLECMFVDATLATARAAAGG
jgi:hypothetical protein